MINYEALEPLIEALLAPLVDEGCQVRGMPNEARKTGVASPVDVPVIVHSWMGAVPAGDSSTDGKTQALRNQIAIDVRTPLLRGPLGQYQLPGRVETILQGARFPGIGRLAFAGWQMDKRSEVPNDRAYMGLMVFTLLSMS